MSPQVSTHVTLLNRLIDGSDAAAWSDFQDRYGALIIGFARRQGASESGLDDILQDVLISLTRAMPEFRYDPTRGRFRSYLKTIAVRAFFKKARQNGVALSIRDTEHAAVAAAQAPEADEIWEKEWRQYHLRLAMQRIDTEFSQTDRLAFRHYAIAGMEPAATAKLLDITINQVYKAKSNILKRLGELIDIQVEEEG